MNCMVSDTAWINSTQIIADTSYMMFRELLLVILALGIGFLIVYGFKDIIIEAIRGIKK